MVDRVTDYYNATASHYDEMHGGDKDPEHIRALEYSWPIIEDLGVQSVLDVGCGTGRGLHWIRTRAGHLRLSGVEPSPELRALAQAKLPDAELLSAKGEALPFADGSRDLVVATGVMHHADDPRAVMREMFRVASKAVLISDHNNFAFGGSPARWLRLWLYATHLLAPATFIKQGFRKQGYSHDDGWWYAYSLLNDFGLIASLSARQLIIPTRPSQSAEPGNFLLAQSHMAVLALKE
jgi:ubiquinone/menaquinone biosynthesis C-methylase UbiE